MESLIASIATEPITVMTVPIQRDELMRQIGAAEIGQSEEGREILGLRIGHGPIGVSLIAGCHADEPIGCETIGLLAVWLSGPSNEAAEWRERCTWHLVPQVNPDGESRNLQWITTYPRFHDFLQYVDRDPPGRDIEFGFPAMRRENRVLTDWFKATKRIDLHLSLHGMSVAEGGMLLIERTVVPRMGDLRERYREALLDSGVGLHDHDRGGAKGFDYLGAGFQTTPEGQRMAAHFRELGDERTAAKFHLSSMEYVRSLWPRCACLVTEVPLWRITRGPLQPTPGGAERYQAMRADRASGMDAEALSARYGLQPVPIATAMSLQLHAINLGLHMVGA